MYRFVIPCGYADREQPWYREDGDSVHEFTDEQLDDAERLFAELRDAGRAPMAAVPGGGEASRRIESLAELRRAGTVDPEEPGAEVVFLSQWAGG